MQKVFLGKLGDIPPGRAKTFLAEGKRIFVINQGGELKAYVNLCPHMGGSVRMDGANIKCNMHGALFDIATGLAKTQPADEGTGLEPAKVSLEGDDIYYFPPEEKKSMWADDF